VAIAFQSYEPHSVDFSLVQAAQKSGESIESWVASLMSFSGIVGRFPWNIETDGRATVISNETVDRLCSDFTRFLIVVECSGRLLDLFGGCRCFLLYGRIDLIDLS
jgi:hypothetical protein